MRSQVIAHFALLLLGAALSYLAWNRPDDGAGERGVVLAQLEEADIEEVHLRWPEGELSVTPLRSGEETTWVASLSYDEVQKPAKEAKKDDGARAADAGPSVDEGAPAEPEKVRKSARFPGGRSVGRALETLAPLSARRSLGPVEPDRLEAMGLVQPERRLVVKAKGGKSWTFDVGAATYGDQARYARLSGRDDVLLLDSAAVRGLEGSPVRLMEARLVTLESEQIEGMDLRAGDRQAAFRHVDRDQPKKRHFVRADAPEQRSEEASGLLSTLRGLRVSKYVDKGALAGANARAAVTLRRIGAEPLRVTLYEVSEGSDFLVEAGPWIAEVPASRGKNLLDDIIAALPAE